MALVLVACSTAIDDVGVPIEGLDLAPRRTTAAAGHVATGPVVELARGSIDGADFAIVAWSEFDGLCIFAMSGADSGLACGPAPEGPAGQVDLLMTDAMGSGGPLELVGAASAEVTEVVAELPDGRRARGSLVPLAPAELEGSVFLLVLPADVGDHEVVVLGADGVELQRLQLVDAGQARRGGAGAAPGRRAERPVSRCRLRGPSGGLAMAGAAAGRHSGR